MIQSLCIWTVCALTSFTAYLSLPFVATALCLTASFTPTSLQQSSNSFLHCFYVAITISPFSVHPYVVRGVRAIVFRFACCHISNTQHVVLQCLYSASVLGISICTFSNDWYKQIIVCTKRHFLQCLQMWFVAWHACICTFSNATLEPSVFGLVLQDLMCIWIGASGHTLPRQATVQLWVVFGCSVSYTKWYSGVYTEVSGIVHFDIPIFRWFSLVAIFDFTWVSTLHVGTQQLSFTPLCLVHLGLCSGFLTSLVMSSWHERQTGLCGVRASFSRAICCAGTLFHVFCVDSCVRGQDKTHMSYLPGLLCLPLLWGMTVCGGSLPSSELSWCKHKELFTMISTLYLLLSTYLFALASLYSNTYVHTWHTTYTQALRLILRKCDSPQTMHGNNLKFWLQQELSILFMWL